MIPLIGYVNKLSARPGDTLEFKVSSTFNVPFQASLVRIRCSDPNPAGPGIREKSVDASFTGQYPSRIQNIHLGSYGIVDSAQPLKDLNSFTMSTTIWPTTPKKGRQAIIAWGDQKRSGGVLGIKKDGLLFGEIGKININHSKPLHTRHWYTVWMAYDAVEQTLSVGCLPLSAKHTEPTTIIETINLDMPPDRMSSPLLFGAEQRDCICSHFNGKIEHPRIHSFALGVENFPIARNERCFADWDFAKEMSSTRLIDNGSHELNGRLVNLPARAMTGSNWTAKEMCWRHAPEQYGAIHFHDDDLHDCDWQTDFIFLVPDDLASGLYGAKLKCRDREDIIPFVICPPKGKNTADLCLVIPTFTYVIYANHARPEFGDPWRKRAKDWDAYPWNPGDHPEYGLSTYNFHTDGSGICHSSALRPILTMRPGYFTIVDHNGSGLRHLQADTHLIDWLEEQEFSYDLISDQEVHEEGRLVLEPYRTVLTATHPEYHTNKTLDAIEAYRDGGGRFVYLGGNGFYWKVAMHLEEKSVIEIRRGEGGIRAWAAEPGEYYNAFDGEYGGLWRRNGRPPQQIAGVGFSAQGTFFGSYYQRLEASFESRFSWAFKGIDDKRLGDFGLSGGGAAGYELDRADVRLGTPENAVVLASSEGHSRDYTGDEEDFFVLVPEEQLTHMGTWPGDSIKNLIRADMVFYQTANGGAVFSVGSITFCGSLPCNDYNNNISKLLRNVIERFLDPNPDFGKEVY